MKKLLLLTFSLISISTFAQEQNPAKSTDNKGLDIWLNFGCGKWTTSKQNNLLNFNSGINAVLAEKHYFSLQYNTGFSKGFLFNPDEIYMQHLQYVNYGQREKLHNGIYFTPSVGIGIVNYSITKFTKENSTIASSFVTDLIFDGTGKTTYGNYQEKSICIPMNLEMDFTGRFVGLGIGVNLIFMKYPSFGFTANLLIGKVHPRIKK